MEEPMKHHCQLKERGGALKTTLQQPTYSNIQSLSEATKGDVTPD